MIPSRRMMCSMQSCFDTCFRIEWWPESKTRKNMTSFFDLDSISFPIRFLTVESQRGKKNWWFLFVSSRPQSQGIPKQKIPQQKTEIISPIYTEHRHRGKMISMFGCFACIFFKLVLSTDTHPISISRGLICNLGSGDSAFKGLPVSSCVSWGLLSWWSCSGIASCGSILFYVWWKGGAWIQWGHLEGLIHKFLTEWAIGNQCL